MLLDKSSQSNSQSVFSFKTVYGEEIISRIAEETDTELVLMKPLTLVATPNGGMGLSVCMFSTEAQTNVRLNKSAIVMTASTAQQIANQYLEQTTGLRICT
jgi:hypothetical protein